MPTTAPEPRKPTGGPPAPIPSRRTIARRAAAIRRGWSPAEELRRRVTGAVPWFVPVARRRPRAAFELKDEDA
jgi:hypothetical protein